MMSNMELLDEIKSNANMLRDYAVTWEKFMPQENH